MHSSTRNKLLADSQKQTERIKTSNKAEKRPSTPTGQLPTPKRKEGQKSEKKVKFANQPQATSSKTKARTYASVAASTSRHKAYANVSLAPPRNDSSSAESSLAEDIQGLNINDGSTNVTRRTVYCSASATMNERHPILEGDIEDPFDHIPPPIDEYNPVVNPNARIVYYEDSVLLDSRASDCMTYAFAHLHMIRTAHAEVCVADGTVHNSDYKGLMRISANNKTQNV